MAVSKGRLGKFEIVRELGRGGFSIVYLAVDTVMHREVALKVPLPYLLLSRGLRRRWLREAEAAASLDHPNIVPAYEAGEIGPVSYIASAYCSGPTLATWLKQQPGGLPPHDAVRIVAALASAVEHAHRRGILHRDIKPSNVMLQKHEIRNTKSETNSNLESTKDQNVSSEVLRCENSDFGVVSDFDFRISDFIPKLTDFGLAKLQERTERTDATRTGAVLGTPRYMAPEQAAGRRDDVGPATDVHALGVILFQLLTGDTPFEGQTEAETLWLVQSAEADSPRRWRLELPRDLESICLQCLAKQPDRRYTTAEALEQDLRRFLAGHPVHARQISMPERGAKWVRRHPTASSIIASLTIASAAFVLFMWWTHARWTDQGRLLERAITGEREQEDEADTQKAAAREQQRLVGRHRYASNIRLVQQFYESGKLAEASAVLDELRHRSPQELDFAWRFWWRRLVGELVPFAKATGDIRATAFSPDGSMLAVACIPTDVLVWDLGTRQLRGRYRLSGHGNRYVAFLSNEELFVSCGLQHVARLLDSKGGLVRDLRLDSDHVGHEGYTHNALPISGGNLLLVTCGNEAKLLRLTDLAEVQHLRASVPIDCVAVSPDGATLALTSRYETAIWVYDLATGLEKHRLDGHTAAIFAVAFSPDGQRLATASADRTIRLWVVSTGEGLTQLAGHSLEINSVTWSPDGKLLASTGNDGTVRLWNSDTGTQLPHIVAKSTPIMATAFSPDGETIALGDGQDAVSLWRPCFAGEGPSPKGHAVETWSVVFLPNSRVLVSGSDDHTIRLWDRVSGQELACLGGHTATVASLAISPDGRMLASASLDGTVKLWDVEISEAASSLAHRTPIVAPPETSTLGRGASDTPLVTVRERSTLRHNDRVRCVAFGCDGRTLASGSYDSIIRLWDTDSGELRGSLAGHDKKVRAILFASDGGTLVSSSDDSQVRIWDLERGTARQALQDSIGVWCVALSPDGRTLATGNADGLVRFWDATTGELRENLKGHSGGVRSVAFSPDGNTLASGGMDRTVRLWDPKTGQELMVLRGHEHHVNSVAFALDGTVLASVSHDGAVKLWHAAPLEHPRDSPHPRKPQK